MDNFNGVLTDNYLSEFYSEFERKYEKLIFERQENGYIHNSVEWGNWVYECLKENKKEEMIKALRDVYKNYVPGKLSRDDLRSSKNLILSLITVLVHYAVRDRIVENEPALTAADVCINMCEETTNREDLLMCAYAGLIKISDLIKDYKERDYHPLINKVKKYVYKYLHVRIKVKDMAKAFNVSSEHLSRTFKKIEGITIQDYILNERIIRAEEMLKTSNLSISDISMHLAFNSQSHFTEMFRKKTGKTPLQYKNDCSDNYVTWMPDVVDFSEKL